METKTQLSKPTKLTPSQIRAMDSFLSERKTPFRRSTLMEVLKGTVSPRTTARMEAVADLALKTLAKQLLITRSGHQHWVAVDADAREVRLKSGRVVLKADDQVVLSFRTRTPEKWVLTDLETGAHWMFKEGKWKSASKVVAQELKGLVLGAT